jgi:hypothetical protein
VRVIGRAEGSGVLVGPTNLADLVERATRAECARRAERAARVERATRVEVANAGVDDNPKTATIATAIKIRPDWMRRLTFSCAAPAVLRYV